MHGLLPATCSICRERNAPKPPKRVAAPKRPAGSRSVVTARTSTPRRPAAAATSRESLAGRAQYFGQAARGVWWLDQTGRHEEEWAAGVVRSLRPPGGTVPAASRNVGEIRTGDLTIHVVAGEIVAVGTAASNGMTVAGPPAGWLAEVELSALKEALVVRDLPTALKPGPPHPFTNQGFTQPGVCFPYPPPVAARLARTKLAALLVDDAGEWALLLE